jgi:hypothetical protein
MALLSDTWDFIRQTHVLSRGKMCVMCCKTVEKSKDTRNTNLKDWFRKRIAKGEGLMFHSGQ